MNEFWFSKTCEDRKKIKTFMDYIKFEYIPCDVIIKEIYPLKIVSHFIIIRALARQADPSFQDFPPVEELLLSPSSPERKVRRRRRRTTTTTK